MVGVQDIMAQINNNNSESDYTLPTKSLAEREADGEDFDLEKDWSL
jgi:hypothetical protein